MEILKLLVQAMIFLLSIITIQSCGSQGWIIGNIPLTPQDSVTNSVFIEIVDADSTMHWYHGNITNYNWCYKHEEYEEVVVK